MKFRNPANNYIENISYPMLACLLFGPLYFVYHGAWRHVLVGLCLGVCTLGLSWLLYPFFARRALYESYMRAGWQSVNYAQDD
jgi:hypothetical protein